MSRCMRFLISGRVQGVGYRAGVLAQARRLDLAGYVRNLDDGGVEVLACGDATKLERLQDWLHEGPPLAMVTDVRAEGRVAPPVEGGFRVL